MECERRMILLEKYSLNVFSKLGNLISRDKRKHALVTQLDTRPTARASITESSWRGASLFGCDGLSILDFVHSHI